MNVDAAFFQFGFGSATTIHRNGKGEALAVEPWILNNLLDATTT